MHYLHTLKFKMNDRWDSLPTYSAEAWPPSDLLHEFYIEHISKNSNQPDQPDFGKKGFLDFAMDS
jgi:hypothetical protein